MVKKIIALFLVIILIPQITLSANIVKPIDLNENHWGYKYMKYTISEKLIEVDRDNKFYPEEKITREESAKIIIKSAGIDTASYSKDLKFTDIEEKNSFYPYISKAVELGIIKGYEDNTFKPQNKITRAEFLKILLVASKIEINESINKSKFKDVSDWQIPFVEKGVELGIVNGYSDGTFRPENNLTRAEGSKIIYAFAEYQGKNIEEISTSDALAEGDIKFVFNEYEKLAHILINISRQEEKQKGGLELDPLLSKVAREHAQYLADNKMKNDHTGKDNSTPFDRIKAKKIEYISAAENIGWSSSNNRTVAESILAIHQDPLSGMMSEPENQDNHRANILGTFHNFDKVGIGVVVSTNEEGKKEVHIVQNFIQSKK